MAREWGRDDVVIMALHIRGDSLCSSGDPRRPRRPAGGASSVEGGGKRLGRGHVQRLPGGVDVRDRGARRRDRPVRGGHRDRRPPGRGGAGAVDQGGEPARRSSSWGAGTTSSAGAASCWTRRRGCWTRRSIPRRDTMLARVAIHRGARRRTRRGARHDGSARPIDELQALSPALVVAALASCVAAGRGRDGRLPGGVRRDHARRGSRVADVAAGRDRPAGTVGGPGGPGGRADRRDGDDRATLRGALNLLSARAAIAEANGRPDGAQTRCSTRRRGGGASTRTRSRRRTPCWGGRAARATPQSAAADRARAARCSVRWARWPIPDQ